MLRIQFVNQHYWPDTESTGQHLTDVAEHLAACGHEVRVLCGRRQRRESTRLPAREVRNGVEIHRVTVPEGAGLRGRMLGYVAFHAAVAPRVLSTRWPDIVVTLTTPPMLGAWGSLGTRLHGWKHVCYLMDHHPDAEFEAGMLSRTSLIGRTLEAAYGWTLRNATHNVVLGPYQGERTLARGVSPKNLSTIPIWSWADETRATPEEADAIRRELGWKGFVVLYSGNAGQVHRFDELLAAMQRLDETRPDIHFAFLGGGPRRPEIEAFARAHKLENASFHPYVARERIGALLAAADAHFVSLRGEQVGVSVPSKLYGQLASERPVVFVGPERCESAEDVLASNAGINVAIDDVDGLVAAFESLSGDQVGRARMGKAGREWFLRHREKAVCCAAWTDLLERVGEVETDSQDQVAIDRVAA